jgi:KDO2-lipid IV(A) lauroyltransferase
MVKCAIQIVTEEKQQHQHDSRRKHKQRNQQTAGHKWPHLPGDLYRRVPFFYTGCIQYLLVRFALFTLDWGPRWFSFAIARSYTRLLDLFLPRLRRVARRNLELAGYPADVGEGIIDGVFASIARLLVTFARFPQMNCSNIGEWIRYEGLEHFEEAKRLGRGVLFATAHFGNWELSAFAHGLLTEPMNVVVRPLDDQAVDALVESRRQLSGNRLIQKRDAARGILRALAANEAVGILVDQNSSLAEGVFVDFFGVPACANVAFARIAARSGAAVIPGFAVWEPAESRYVLRFYPAIEITGDAHADTQRLHSLLESVIRQNPGQWLWIHRRWKTRPPGEGPVY